MYKIFFQTNLLIIFTTPPPVFLYHISRPHCLVYVVPPGFSWSSTVSLFWWYLSILFGHVSSFILCHCSNHFSCFFLNFVYYILLLSLVLLSPLFVICLLFLSVTSSKKIHLRCQQFVLIYFVYVRGLRFISVYTFYCCVRGSFFLYQLLIISNILR